MVEPATAALTSPQNVFDAPANTPTAQNDVKSDGAAKTYIYQHESNGRLDAVNANSGACSLGQALPCSKLAIQCPDWQTDYSCDDAFFDNYATSRYGSWEQARAFWEVNRWW